MLDGDELRGWLVVLIVLGPLLALSLPHRVSILIVGLYLLVPLVIFLLGGPEKPWKYG
jgi:hypothetical protein